MTKRDVRLSAMWGDVSGRNKEQGVHLEGTWLFISICSELVLLGCTYFREVELLRNDWYSGCNLMPDNPLTRSKIPVPQHLLLHINSLYLTLEKVVRYT